MQSKRGERRLLFAAQLFESLNFAALHVMLSAPSVLIRLALQISCATLAAALLLWSDPSADITELAAE
jgi:hypothetical protein